MMDAELDKGTPVRITCVGDIALNGSYEALINEGKGSAIVNSLTTCLRESDLVIGNLEGPLTSCPASGPPWRFNLRGNPAYAAILRTGGFDVLTLANNHLMDSGREGLEETLRNLDAAGIQYVGAGMNLDEARRPLFMTVRETKVAILAYCGVATSSSLYASHESAGIAPLRPEFIFEDIAKVRSSCHVLIACIHWGQENIREPAPKYRRLARELIGAGVDIIVGHHPHVLQGIERIDEGVVAYSLGNFAFSDEYWQGGDGNGRVFVAPYILSENNRRSAAWTVHVAPGGRVVKEELIPLYLGRDLLLTVDMRAERDRDQLRRNAVLSTPMYAAVWAMRMASSRLGVIMQVIKGERGYWQQFIRIRPHHFRGLVRMLVREWENYRGQE